MRLLSDSRIATVIDATKDLVCAYKPNLAFYEQYGPAGYQALFDMVQAIPQGIPTIADVKRGDVGHTARAYARAVFDEMGFDALTVTPYIGRDTIEPFAERAERGVVVGRKNHYGSRSQRGTEVAALFYSFIESAKLCGLDPKEYLRTAVMAALHGEQVPLPHEVAARK